jgi:hypothetical protein
MVALIDSHESDQVLALPARPFIVGRNSIMTALTASCLLVSTARAGDLEAVLEKKSDESVSSGTEDSDAFPKTGLDPTVLNSQVSLTNEFKDQELDAAKDTLTLNLSYAFGNKARPDWTAQVDLPVVHYDAGRNKGVGSSSGFGDLEMRVGHVIRAEGIFRYAAGLEAEFDTGGGPNRGDGIFRLSPIVAFAIQSTRTFKFQMFVQFNQSLWTDSGTSRETEIHLKPAVNVALPDHWYAYTEFEEEWALQSHGAFSATAKFEIGRSFGAHDQWVLSARCEIPITSSSDDYTVTAGCSYVFQ